MELWEGAILIVGGLALVGYMGRKQAAMQSAGVANLAAATTVDNSGLSNTSNLTNVTNTAGGNPTVWGETLAPPPPQIVPSTTVLKAPVRMPIARPVMVNQNTVPITGVPSSVVIGGRQVNINVPQRPMNIHLL